MTAKEMLQMQIYIYIYKLMYQDFPMNIDTAYLDGAKHSYKGYVVFCEGPCKEVTAKLKYARGDPDLYGREESPPDITSSDSDCNDCPDCRSRAGGGTEDKCTFTIGSKKSILL